MEVMVNTGKGGVLQYDYEVALFISRSYYMLSVCKWHLSN